MIEGCGELGEVVLEISALRRGVGLPNLDIGFIFGRVSVFAFGICFPRIHRLTVLTEHIVRVGFVLLLKRLLTVEDVAADFVLIPAAPSLSFEIDLRDISGGGILDLHFTFLLGIHGAKKDVSHAGCGPIDYVHFIFGPQPNYLAALRNRFYTRTVKHNFGVGVAGINPVIRFRMQRCHGWVVADLLSEVLIVRGKQLESFSQDRVKRFVQPVIWAFVLRYRKRNNVKHSHKRIVGLISLIEQICILHDFRHFLHHRDRLVEVNWNSKA